MKNSLPKKGIDSGMYKPPSGANPRNNASLNPTNDESPPVL